MTANRFTRPVLETEGFTGWITFKQMREEDKVPRVGGIYVVARRSAGNPEFLDVTPEDASKARTRAYPRRPCA